MKNILNQVVRRIKQNPVQSLTLLALDLACWIGMIYFTVYAFTLSITLGLFLVLSYSILMFFVVSTMSRARHMAYTILHLQAQMMMMQQHSDADTTEDDQDSVNVHDDSID